MCIAVFTVSRFVYFAREDRCADAPLPILQKTRIKLCVLQKKIVVFDDNFIANAEEFFLPFEIKKIVHDLLLCIGDDCIAMLKNCPDVATCLLMLCGALTDLTIDTVITFY